MRTIVAGSRSITDYEIVKKAIEESGIEVTEVVSGCARGVDQLGERWAEENDVPVKRFPADWKRYGRVAGMKRNSEMVAYAEAMIPVWDGKSRGTADTIKKARRKGLVLPKGLKGI